MPSFCELEDYLGSSKALYLSSFYEFLSTIFFSKYYKAWKNAQNSRFPSLHLAKYVFDISVKYRDIYTMQLIIGNQTATRISYRLTIPKIKKSPISKKLVKLEDMNLLTTLKHILLLGILLLGLQSTSLGQCSPDTEAPIAICDFGLQFNSLPNDQLVLTGEDIAFNSTDNCTAFADLEFFISGDVDLPFTPNSQTLSFSAGAVGSFDVAVWVQDEAGLVAKCWTTIQIVSLLGGCDPDETAPVAVCQLNYPVSYDPEMELTILATDLDNGSYDNCTSALNYTATLDIFDTSIPQTTSITIDAFTPPGTYQAALWIEDEAGHFNSCIVNIQLSIGDVNCTTDTIPPVAECHLAYSIQELPGEQGSITGVKLNHNSYDFCTNSEELEFFVTLDGSLTSPPETQEIFFPPNTNEVFVVYLWVVDANGNFSVCSSDLYVSTLYLVEGYVFIDENDNCELDEPSETGFGYHTLAFSVDGGQTFGIVTTDENGLYGFSFQGWGLGGTVESLIVQLNAGSGMSNACPTVYEFELSELTNTPEVFNFPVQLATDCSHMAVDIGAPFLRRCFTSTYTAGYSNNSAFDIDDVELAVQLHPDMALQNTSFPYTDLGNNLLVFELGTVASGTGGQIQIEVILDCDAELGSTKCITAEISPFDCNLPAPNWSGADLVVTGECDETSDMVTFRITNQGSAPMSAEQNFIVIEDVIMYMYEPIQLGPGEFEEVSFDATGATWYVEIPQEAGHPSLSMPSAVVEGCGGFGTIGLVNQFPMPDVDPNLSIACLEVNGSFDPNDKSAAPEGYGENHFIDQNVSLEYKLRFQNTGNDTAFTVRLEDQLDPSLDWTTVAAGAASHPYRMELSATGNLVFHFENILLPDSTTNEPGSHGFVQFRINQLPDVELGTAIQNSAGIYFDFNEPIITNTVNHIVGEEFIVTSTHFIPNPQVDLSISPNPMRNKTIFSLSGKKITDGSLELFDYLGRKVKTKSIFANEFKFSKDGLTPGCYFFTIKNEGNFWASGKLLVL